LRLSEAPRILTGPVDPRFLVLCLSCGLSAESSALVPTATGPAADHASDAAASEMASNGMATSAAATREAGDPSRATPATPAGAANDALAAEDARARAAFEKLTPALRKEFADYLELEISGLGTFQTGLVAWVVRRQDRDPSAWKTRAEAAFFDPEVHAPAQPIARTRLTPDSSTAIAARRSILGRGAARRLVPAFEYDYASGELVRVPCADEPARVFGNALAGYPPRLDLAEALVERELDDGSQRAAAQAFAHAYTDRVGNVYPGITLYDAHASGAEIEMPDVDTLGIVHTLLPNVDTWKAPVPASQQDDLYRAIGERFVLLHHHRSLRHALARTYLNGSETLRDGYGPARDNLHALWEDCASTPETLRARLPKAEDWTTFLEAWAKACAAPDSPYAAGVRRRTTLDAEAAAVRACVLRGLAEFGVLDAGTKPAAPPSEGPEKHAYEQDS